MGRKYLIRRSLFEWLLNVGYVYGEAGRGRGGAAGDAAGPGDLPGVAPRARAPLHLVVTNHTLPDWPSAGRAGQTRTNRGRAPLISLCC